MASFSRSKPSIDRAPDISATNNLQSNNEQDIGKEIHNILSLDTEKSHLRWYKQAERWIIVSKLNIKAKDDLNAHKSQILVANGSKLKRKTVDDNLLSTLRQNTKLRQRSEENLKIIRQLLHTIDSLYKTYDYKRRITETLKQDKAKLQLEIDELKKQNKAFKKTIRQKIAEKEEEFENEKYQKAQQELKLKKQNNELKHTIHELKKKNKYSSKFPDECVEKLAKQIISQEQESQELERANKVLVMKNKTSQQSIEILQSDHKWIVDEYNSTVGGSKQKIDGQELAIEQLKIKISILEDERKEFEMKINDLTEENKRLKRDPDKYKEWNVEDVINWMICLDPGEFSKYEEKMRKVMVEEEVTGDLLTNDIDIADLKRWGIIKLKHTKQVLKAIQSLITEDNKANANKNDAVLNEEANTPTAYI